MNERELAMNELRASVKQRRIRYADIAQAAGNSSSGWVGEVLRGNYPHYKAYRLPKNIRLALQNYGFDVPACLRTF